MTRILIAEDEARIVSFLVKGLHASGYTSLAVGTGGETLAVARDDCFDLLILDLGLPDMNGHDVLRMMRARGEVMPVIILTASADVSDVITGFERGADDYVTKPFSFEELLARIRLRLRDRPRVPTNVLSAGGIELDLRRRRATIGSRAVELTTREFELTEVFVRHAGRVLSRQQLLSRVWGYDFDPRSNIVDAYVRTLRRKFGSEIIETVRGVGYRLRVGGASMLGNHEPDGVNRGRHDR